MWRDFGRRIGGWRVATPLLTVATSTALGLWVLKIWRGSLRTPFDYSRDSLAQLMAIKGIVEHGWYETNPSLGAPFGQNLADWPVFAGDHLQLLIVRLMSFVTGDPALLANLYFLLSFPLVAGISYVVIRHFGVSRPVSALCATLFTVLPAHFLRGENHLFLAAYWGVPVGCYLVLAAVRREPLFERRVAPTRAPALAWLSRRSLLTAGCCIVVGTTGLYYASFAAFLLLGAALGLAASTRSWRAALVPGLLAGLIAATLAVNLTPTIAYRLKHGRNHVVRRFPSQSSTFGLRLAAVLLPVEHHRVGPARRLRRRYDRTVDRRARFETRASPIGAVATIGFAWLLLVSLAVIVGARAPGRSGALHRHLAFGALGSYLIGTVAGIANLIAFVIPSLRSWSRISVFVAFFSLLAVGLLLDSARAALSGRLSARAVSLAWPAVLAGVLAVGVLDQTTPAMAPRYSDTGRASHSDAALVRGIEARLPRGAAVFQLPHVAFPESTTREGGSYEDVRPYLHSHHLRWSFGAMKGRPADWSARLARSPVTAVAPAVAAAGFSGILVDRAGYERPDARRLEASLERLTGHGALVSRDRRFAFFDLRGYAARLRASKPSSYLEKLREQTLHPPPTPPGRVPIEQPTG